MSRGAPPSPFCSHARSAALVRTRQWRTVMLGFSDLDVGITVGEFLMGCFLLRWSGANLSVIGRRLY